MKSDYVKEIRAKVGHMPMFNPVVTLIIYKNGKILLQKRSDTNTWAIHGGALELGEKYIEALEREIKEELNIKPISPKLFGIYSGKELFNKYPSGDEVYALNHVFICEDYEGEINFNDNEVLEVKWFDIDNLPDNIFEINKPIIRDVKNYKNLHNSVIVD